MRIRWLPIALILSVLLNVVLALAWFSTLLSAAVLETHTGQTFSAIEAEWREFGALRAALCTEGAARDHAVVEAWGQSRGAETFDKDGFLWLSDIGVRFDDQGAADGVCLPQLWQTTADPPPALAEDDGGFRGCEVQPLC